MPIPDLLSPVPSVRVDVALMKQTLAFAFASGVPDTAFADTVARAGAAFHRSASSWRPEAFVKELFVADFVAAIPVFIENRPYPIDHKSLVRLLSLPPSDQAVVEFRRAILVELTASHASRGDFELIYGALHQLRALLEAPPLSRRSDGSRRKLDILSAIKLAVLAMASAFESAASGLSRIGDFGRAMKESAAFQRLLDLLDYHENLATLDVRVRLGIDGRVRSLEMLAIKENESNWFYASPLGRAASKIAALLRGYRFTEGEVLARLIDGVFDGVEGHVVTLVQLIGDMEFYLAALVFRDRAEQAGLPVCLPELLAPSGGAPTAQAGTASVPAREIRDLWNPLLLSQGGRVVPCDIVTERHGMTVIVTGPNSGGKTRLLQSLALTQMLGQSGFFVPAREAKLLLAPGLFVSLIEEATADQSEGRLGMELVRIRSLFEKLGVGALVILDELCSGTNPSEGEEIFELVITLLAELRPQAFITTHFLQLAARIAARPPVPLLAFLQVELDKNQVPTYRFKGGVAETSLAHRTAARLGVTREELSALVERSLARAARLSEGT